MIKWYDWVFALLMSNIILKTLIIWLYSSSIFESFSTTFIFFFLLELWNKYYCNLRLKMERL